MNTPIVVTTCDSYDWLLPGFADRFNKWWSIEQPVTVLCYRQPPELPSNFSPFLVPSENKFYSAMLRVWLTAHPSAERVLLMLDDYYLNRPVCVDVITYFDLMMSRDEGIAKFHLDNAVQNQEHEDRSYPLVEMKQTARYRSSLQAAIWQTSYLAKLCVADRTPWQFELDGEKECMNDRMSVMGSRHPPMHYDNVMKNGDYVGK